MERVIFLTVLHWLFTLGSDRFCHKWHQEYVVQGVDGLAPHHRYRTMASSRVSSRTLSKKIYFICVRTSLQVSLSSSSTPRRSVVKKKEGKPSVSVVKARTIAPISKRWLWVLFSTTKAIPFAKRCGQVTWRM